MEPYRSGPLPAGLEACIFCLNVGNVNMTSFDSCPQLTNLLQDGNCELEHEVRVMFIVRKLLNISTLVCEDMLVRYGSPSTWLRVCDECSEIVKQSMEVTCKIVELQRTFESLKVSTRRKILDSSGDDIKQRRRVNGASETIRSTVLEREVERGDKTTISEEVIVKIESHSDEVDSDSISAQGVQPEACDESDPDFIPSRTSSRAKPILKSKSPAKKHRGSTLKPNHEAVGDGNEEIFKCHLCSFSNTRKFNLNRHLRMIHWVITGDMHAYRFKHKTFKCEKCGQVLKNIEERIQHMLHEHKMLQCDKCSKLFTANDKLNYHKHRHHKESKRKLKSASTSSFRTETTQSNHDTCVKEPQEGNTAIDHARFEERSDVTSLCEDTNEPMENKIDVNENVEDNSATVLKKAKRKYTRKIPLQCPHCPSKHKTKSLLNRHVKNAHSKASTAMETEPEVTEFKCPYCVFRNCDKGNFVRHVRNVHSKVDGDESLDIPPRRKKVPFRCGKCSKTFDSQDDLSRHKVTTHGMYKCDHCPKVFPYQGYLLVHTKRYHGPNSDEFVHHKRQQKTVNEETGVAKGKLKCSICTEIFPNLTLLKSHRVSVHPERFSCDKCEQLCFDSLSRLYQHKVKVHKEPNNPYKCTQCDYSNPSYHEIERHKTSIHEKQARLICELCSESYSNERGLLFHKVRVHGENQLSFSRDSLQCKFCGKLFSSPYYLVDHEDSVHRGKHRYQCEKCPKGFRCQQQLDTHVQTFHLKILPFCCTEDGCDRKFPSKTRLTWHHRKTHLKERKHKCSLCGKAFATRSGRLRHEEIHSSESSRPYQCHLCGKDYGVYQYFQLHFRLHIKRGETDEQCPRRYTFSTGDVA